MAMTQLRADTLSDERAEQVYLLTDQASTTAAKAALIAGADATFAGLPLNVRQSSVSEEDGEGGVYLGRAVYGYSGGANTADLEVGDTRIVINSVGGSTNITQSLATVASYGAAQDFKGAIGVDSEGNIQGTTIVTGGLDFTVVKIVASTDLTTTYLGSLLALTTPNPTTNAAPFSHEDSDGRQVSLAIGEGLFLGFQNTPRGNGEDELRFNFKGSKNLTGITVGDITDIAKKGWEHLWVHYEPKVDDVANKLVQNADAAYVEKIYNAGDWSALGLAPIT